MRTFTIVAAGAATMTGFTLAADSVELFIDDSGDDGVQYAASIVDACRDYTVYALQCITAIDLPPSLCEDAGVSIAH